METDNLYFEVVKEMGDRIGLGDLNAYSKEIAKKMLNIGIPLNEIALITDLDLETIESLK